ncbi:hypothetical protein [Crateriforma conspicua]|uniref:hypothetical protein n=1 Tax=Crateriforma conspicua TaxID=2527996 RepID=UPI00118792D6|nr:hypothetical protein [Crateriforma conspicua]QDV61974.1 hypothetical protein Mal65_11020 [Crateriforma conspicua]
MSNTNSNKPVHTVRIGLNSIAIFKNVTQSGRAIYNASFERSYKDGDEWKYTRSFGLEDLCIQSELIEHAKSWIFEQQQADAKSDSYEDAA